MIAMLYRDDWSSDEVTVTGRFRCLFPAIMHAQIQPKTNHIKLYALFFRRKITNDRCENIFGLQCQYSSKLALTNS